MRSKRWKALLRDWTPMQTCHPGRARLKNSMKRRALVVVLVLVTGLLGLLPASLVLAQAPFPAIPVRSPPKTPEAQRNALNAVRSEVNWLRNACRTAFNY